MQTEESNENSAPDFREKLETSESLIHPTPDNPPWNIPAAIGLWLASVFFIAVLPFVLIIPYLLKNGMIKTDGAELQKLLQNDPTSIILSVAATLPAHILTLLLAWFIVTKANRFSFKEMLGWQTGGFRWWHYLSILLGFFAVAAIVGYFLPEQENEMLRILRSSRTVVYIVAFMATFTAPIVEEVIYRGVLYSAVQRSVGVPAAVFIVTALFAIVHFPQYYPSYSTIFLICLLSLILTLIRVKAKNLLPCIILHTIFNGFQSLVLILEPFLNSAGIPTGEKAAFIVRLFT